MSQDAEARHSRILKRLAERKRWDPETISLVRIKLCISDRLMAVYKAIEQSPPRSCFNAANLVPFNIELLPWDPETDSNKPIYFQQISREKFTSNYTVPEEFFYTTEYEAYNYGTTFLNQLENATAAVWDNRADIPFWDTLGWIDDP